MGEIGGVRRGIGVIKLVGFALGLAPDTEPLLDPKPYALNPIPRAWKSPKRPVECASRTLVCCGGQGGGGRVGRGGWV